MANKTVYIDTANDPGGDGTSGDPYDTWAVWESAEDGAETYTLGDVHTVKCRGLDSWSSSLLVTGWSNDVHITFEAWDTADEANAQNKGAGFTSTAASRAVLMYRRFSIKNLRCISSTSTRVMQNSTSAHTKSCSHENSYFETGTATSDWNIEQDDGETTTFTNCVLKNVVVWQDAHPESGATGSVVVTNCTFDNAYEESVLGGAYSICSVYNCLDLNSDADTFNGAEYEGYTRYVHYGVYKETDSATNYTTDTGTVWASSLVDTDIFVSPSGDDYQLSATGEADSTITTTGDGSDNNAPLTDANGVTRGTTSCSVGAFEPAPAAGGGPRNPFAGPFSFRSPLG